MIKVLCGPIKTIEKKSPSFIILHKNRALKNIFY